MSCLALIRSARDEMSANEKRLADFILDNATLVRDYSSQQIAASVGISQSSVVKFSQKLGYKGFTDLKLAIHESVVKQESNVASLHGKGRSRGEEPSLTDKLYQLKCDAISVATDLNSQASLMAAARILDASATIQVVGSGFASVVAQDFAMKLRALGKTVVTESDAELQLIQCGRLSRNDCLVVISATGQEPHLSRLAKPARKTGVKILSITNQAANPVAALADVRLYSLAKGGDAAVPDLVTDTSRQHIVDLVFSMLQRHGVGSGRGTGKRRRIAEVSKAK